MVKLKDVLLSNHGSVSGRLFDVMLKTLNRQIAESFYPQMDDFQLQLALAQSVEPHTEEQANQNMNHIPTATAAMGGGELMDVTDPSEQTEEGGNGVLVPSNNGRMGQHNPAPGSNLEVPPELFLVDPAELELIKLRHEEARLSGFDNYYLYEN